MAIYENGRRARNELCTGQAPAVLEQVGMCSAIWSRGSLDMNCLSAHTFVIATLSLFVKVYGVELDLNFSPQDFFSLSEYQTHLEDQIRWLYRDSSAGLWYSPEVFAGAGLHL